MHDDAIIGTRHLRRISAATNDGRDDDRVAAASRRRHDNQAIANFDVRIHRKPFVDRDGSRRRADGNRIDRLSEGCEEQRGKHA
jgi:hypothetical protein